MSKKFLVALCALIALPVFASTGGQITADELQSFQEQRRSVERDLADGETYSEISQDKRRDVRAALDRIEDRLERAGSVAALSERDKAELFNDQEVVNTILTQAGEDSRMVCERTKKVGSHRTHTICETVAERRRKHEQTQDALRKNGLRVTCGSPGLCGG